jgi:hypothetical protein
MTSSSFDFPEYDRFANKFELMDVFYFHIGIIWSSVWSVSPDLKYHCLNTRRRTEVDD